MLGNQQGVERNNVLTSFQKDGRMIQKGSGLTVHDWFVLGSEIDVQMISS